MQLRRSRGSSRRSPGPRGCSRTSASSRGRPSTWWRPSARSSSGTGAALHAFAEAGVDVAVVEAGLGGRHDATNVLQTRVVVLTNVALDHMDVLGDTREAIAAEKLAVVPSGSTVVLGEAEWREPAE